MRQIEAKMISFLEKKLTGNGLYLQALEQKNARLIFYLAAQSCVGIREVGGNNRGPMVKLIQETVGNAQGEAWCMSFLQTCIAFAEVKTGIDSPIFPSEHCMTVWNKTPKTARVKIRPLKGAIAIWNYVGGASGHTGCLDEFDSPKTGRMRLFEGNTESGMKADGTIERDGGGIYHTDRPTKGTAKMRLVGFLKPF